MTSLSDMFNAAQNIATALNNQAQNSLAIAGLKTATNITSATVIKSSAGRVCQVSVLVAGVSGKIYDGNVSSTTNNPMWVIPATVGVYSVNMPTTYGIVIAPGAGQAVSVSYS